MLHFFLFMCTVSQQTQQHLGDKYLVQISEINGKIQQIYHDFELNKLKPYNQSAFQKLINEIKAEKSALTDVKFEVTNLLSTIVSYSLLDKVYLEFARIMTDSYADALNQIAFEILGNQFGIAQFKPTQVSDEINVATALLKGKFDRIVMNLIDIDTRVATIMSGKNLTTDLLNELRVLDELTIVMKDATVLKTDLYMTYLRESEQITLSGKELSILQKNEVDLHLLMLDWLIQFCSTYQTLVKRLMGNF